MYQNLNPGAGFIVDTMEIWKRISENGCSAFYVSASEYDGAMLTEGFFQIMDKPESDLREKLFFVACQDRTIESEILEGLERRAVKAFPVYRSLDRKGISDLEFREILSRIIDDPEGNRDPDPHQLTASAMLETLTETRDFVRIEGFPELSKTLKLRVHDTFVLAGDTGGGKSSLALNLISQISKTNKILYFNLEMDQRTVFARLLAMESGISLNDLDFYGSSAMSPDKREAVIRAAEYLESHYPILIYQERKISKIIEIIKKQTESEDHVFVFIDHLLLVGSDGKELSNYQKFTNISADLRTVTLNFPITMVLLTQQNRDGKKEHQKPELNSLKETGGIENDACQVAFLWQKWEGSGENARPGARYIVIRKNRSGLNNIDIRVDFNINTQRITESGENAIQESNSPLPDDFKSTQEELADMLDVFDSL